MEKNDKERLDVIWNKGQVVKGYNETLLSRLEIIGPEKARI